jgi:OmpA-OmpF porin, OOP family
MRWAPTILASSVAVFLSSAAGAQLPSIDTRTWRPSVDPTASLVLESPNAPGSWAFNTAAYFDWQLRPLTIKDPTSGNVLYRPIDYGFGVNLLANLGLGKHASLGVVVPAVIYQTGSSDLPTTVAALPVASTALGDVGLSAKVSIIGNPNGGFGLAAIAGFTLPTGDHTSFAGEGAVTAQLKVIADYSFVVADLQAQLGYFLRTEDRTWPDTTVGGYNFGDQIPWSLGLRIRPGILGIDKEDRQTWEIAAHGWLPAGPQAPFGDYGASALSPVMLAVSDRIALGRDKDTFLMAGVDIGLDNAVGVPGVRIIIGAGWAPREHDKDHDGIPDNVDQCEDIPEDRDGFEDSDGCPDIDNDNDGIIDREDACPNVAGPRSSDPKKNGCPQPDRDGDGVPDAEDACPDQKGEPSEDRSKNGCPKVQLPPVDANKDDDGDGIPNSQDACPDLAGEPSTDPKLNGCPNPDDCPDAPEVFNGVKDEDGCPDDGGKPLVTVAQADASHLVLKLQTPIKMSGPPDAPAVDPSSMMTLRALALELNKHRDWVLAVAAKPANTDTASQASALARSLAVVHALTLLTRRDGAAETVGWDAVKNQPTAPSGIGMMLFAAPPPMPPATKPEAKKP